MPATHNLNDLFHQTEKLLAKLQDEGAPEIQDLRERLDRGRSGDRRDRIRRRRGKAHLMHAPIVTLVQSRGGGNGRFRVPRWA